MTHLFHVGEPASTRPDGPLAARPGEARALAGPGGVQIVVAVEEPGDPERRAVETGPVSLGIADRHGRGALLVRAGEPGWPGHLEAAAEIEADVWWGADIELALCDGRGVIRAVRRFPGPTAEPVPSASDERLGSDSVR